MGTLEGYVEGMINLSGGGGGTSDYEELENKPSINGVTLSGNKTTSNLNLSYNDLLNKPYINNMPPSTGADIGDVLTHTSDGDEWAAPEKELPAISAADEGKALIVSNGIAAWGDVVSDSNYSENEQIIGKWIDGKNVYQITIVLSGVTINTTNWISVNINNYVQNIKNIIHYDAIADNGVTTHDITGVFYEVQPYQSGGNQMLDMHPIIASNRTLKYLTLQYTKTTD